MLSIGGLKELTGPLSDLKFELICGGKSLRVGWNSDDWGIAFSGDYKRADIANSLDHGWTSGARATLMFEAQSHVTSLVVEV